MCTNSVYPYLIAKLETIQIRKQQERSVLYLLFGAVKRMVSVSCSCRVEILFQLTPSNPSLQEIIDEWLQTLGQQNPTYPIDSCTKRDRVTTNSGLYAIMHKEKYRTKRKECFDNTSSHHFFFNHSNIYTYLSSNFTMVKVVFKNQKDNRF